MNPNNSSKTSVFNNKQLAETVNDLGYVLGGNIGNSLLKKLNKIYQDHHQFLKQPSGVFHTLYSTDLTYRSRLNVAIQEVLEPVYDNLFCNYKITANLIIAKFSDANSAFDIHQDTTGLDESKHTPLNVWIPLQDTTLDNGCLCVVPKSQKFAFPYRGTSFKGQFDNIAETIKQYLLPIHLKAGEILIFDNRMLHSSPPNTLSKPRVVVMSGIFHKDAQILTCFKKDNSSPIEVYRQNDDYLLTYKGFKSEPVIADSGKKIQEINIIPPISNESDFSALVQQYSLEFYDAFSSQNKLQLSSAKVSQIRAIYDKLIGFLT